MYKETPEEGLIQKYIELQVHPDKSTVEAPSVPRGTIAKQWDLLEQDYVNKLLGYLIDLGPHFVHAKSFKLGYFHDEMMSSYGGVRIFSLYTMRDVHVYDRLYSRYLHMLTSGQSNDCDSVLTRLRSRKTKSLN